MVTDRHTSICTSRDPVFKILAESRRSRVRSKIRRGAFQAQIAMYYPSEPVSMAQTNRQRHSATMAVRGYGAAHLNLLSSRDPVFNLLHESKRFPRRSKIKRGRAFQAQIAMYYPSEPVSMAQTNRQR